MAALEDWHSNDSMATAAECSPASTSGLRLKSQLSRLNRAGQKIGDYMLVRFIFLLGFATGYSAAQSQVISTEAWHAVPDAQGVQIINVECGAGFVDPQEIVVKRNRPVELRVRTAEESQEFVSNLSPGVGKAIGKQATPQRFTPNANGRFPIGCQKQGNGADPNAKGKKKGLLTVIPDNGVK